MKHVKCKSVSRSAGTAVAPDEAVSAWTFAKRDVDSSNCERSLGVLSTLYGHWQL